MQYLKKQYDHVIRITIINIEFHVFATVLEFLLAFKFNKCPKLGLDYTQSRLPSSRGFNHIVDTTLNNLNNPVTPTYHMVIRFSSLPGCFYLYVRYADAIFQGHPSVATAGNDDEDENVDVEGDSETTMYDIVYGGGSSGWHGQQPHNRMRQQPMLMHSGGYNRGET